MIDKLKKLRQEIAGMRQTAEAAVERLSRDADANRGAVIAYDRMLAKLDAQILTASGGQNNSGASEPEKNQE